MQPDPVLARLQLLHPKAIDLSLGRLQRLLKALGDPQNRLPPVIHVAGTNGKGSTIAMLRSIHRAAGRHLHVYTSPHLVRFAERIVLGDHEISDAHLSELLLACEAANDGQPITLFEITTAAAFLAFAESPSDLLLLEVGLGGRFDATNVIPAPALSIITPVSLDHQHFLGDSLEQIAFEKAGILKPGVPAVIGRQPDEALRVLLARADEVGAPSFACGRNWTVRPDNGGMLYEGGGAGRRLPLPALSGRHQVDNAGMALAACELLQWRFPVSDQALATGLTSTRWPARLQRLTRGPLVDRVPTGTEILIDGGHNADAASVIAAEIASWRRDRPERPIHLVFGALNSRPPGDYLAAFRGLVRAVKTVAIPGEANAVAAEDLAAAANAVGLDANPAASVADAVDAICQEAADPGRILICGSLYLAGTVLMNHR